MTQLDNSTAELANGAAKLVDAQAQATARDQSTLRGIKGRRHRYRAWQRVRRRCPEVSTNSPEQGPSRRGDCHRSARRCGECDRGGVELQPTTARFDSPPNPEEITLVQASRAAQKALGALETASASAATEQNDAISQIDTALTELCVPVTEPLVALRWPQQRSSDDRQNQVTGNHGAARWTRQSATRQITAGLIQVGEVSRV